MTSFCVQGGGGVKKVPKYACILIQSSLSLSSCDMSFNFKDMLDYKKCKKGIISNSKEMIYNMDLLGIAFNFPRLGT